MTMPSPRPIASFGSLLVWAMSVGIVLHGTTGTAFRNGVAEGFTGLGGLVISIALAIWALYRQEGLTSWLGLGAAFVTLLWIANSFG